MAGSRVLVTGGAGFIGSHVSAALLQRGADVTVYDDLSLGRAERVPPGARLIVGDVLDPDALRRALVGIDTVVHLAARVSIRASVGGFYEDAQVNLMGTVNLLRVLGSGAVHSLVFASSMAVYADAERPEAIPETYRTEPISPYGISKLAAEKYVLMMAPLLGVRAVALRYFNTYGPGQTYTPYVGVITIFVNRLLAGQPPTIFGTGDQQRDFISVHDVAAATVAALDSPDASGVFNVGTGRPTSVRTLADLLITRLAPGLRPVHEAAQPGEVRNSVADIDRARRLLGWAPTRTLPDSVDEISEANRRLRAETNVSPTPR